MSAVPVIRSLLAGNAILTTAVPAARVFIGAVPLEVALPAIGITTVSGIPQNTLGMHEPQRLVRERIQVTVYAATYPSLDAVMDLVHRALPNTRGLIADLNVQSIVPSTVGPDLEIPKPQIFIRSRDYHVTYLQ
ncbi:DUF3168 domain-containing protein [Castellaniella hirudinis]|uniref:tail completion protein gp17 n=1 Tax=Castellaniella hirudinis TaxID=1144617 RepID=UPI0039C1E6DE